MAATQSIVAPLVGVGTTWSAKKTGRVTSGRSRRRLAGPAVLGWQVVAVLAFAGYRISEAASQPPAVWQDSEAYFAVSMHGLLSTELWTGPRAPLVPLLLKITGGYRHYVIFQAVLAVACWVFLAWTVSRLVRPGWREVVMTWAVLGFATAPLIVLWDWSALSESPSLSTLALLCAVGIWLVRRFTWTRLAVLGVATFAYEGLRDADIWSVTIVAIVILGVSGLRTIRGAALGSERLAVTLHSRWRQHRDGALVGIVLLAVSALTGLAADVSHRNVLNIEEAFYIRVFPFPARVAWLSAHGMPQGQAIDTLAHNTPPATPVQAQVVAPVLTAANWVPLRSWFQTTALTTYAFYLFEHPYYDVTAPFGAPALTYNNAQGDLTFYQASGHQPIAAAQTVFAPNRGVEIFLGFLALAIAAQRDVRRRREWRFLVAFVLVGLLSMLVAWHGEGQEVTRHMVEGNVESRLGVLLCLLLALLGDRPPAQRHAGKDHVEVESAEDQADGRAVASGPAPPVPT
jgi:hypothetical protein